MTIGTLKKMSNHIISMSVFSYRVLWSEECTGDIFVKLTAVPGSNRRRYPESGEVLALSDGSAKWQFDSYSTNHGDRIDEYHCSLISLQEGPILKEGVILVLETDPDAELEDLLYHRIRVALEEIPSTEVGEVYALSIFMDEENPEEEGPVLQFGYNTEAQVTKSLNLTDAKEARWNFAFWLQNQAAFVPDERDQYALRIRRNWLIDRGFYLTDEDFERGDDRVWELQEQRHSEYWRVSARAARRLHDEGVISSRMGGPVPVILHSLEYYEKFAALTQQANPPELEAIGEFLAWCNSD